MTPAANSKHLSVNGEAINAPGVSGGRFLCVTADSDPRLSLLNHAEDRAKKWSPPVAKRISFAAIAHGHDLAEAIVDAIREPLLVLDSDLRVIAASRSFYRTFAVTPRKTEGQKVFDLGDGQWNIPKLRALLEDIIPKRRTVESYEVEHEFPSIGRRVMLLNGRRVFDENGAATAIVLAMRRDSARETDRERTAASVKGNLIRRCSTRCNIFRSRQHSSTQGQDVQSEETRLHLQDAHRESVGGDSATTAARLWIEREDRGRAVPVQAVRQLAASMIGNVAAS